MAKRKRTSRVWEFYELAEVTDEEGRKTKKAICSLCDGLQLTYTGGTTNLLNHLESKHPIAHKTAAGDSDSGTKKQATMFSFHRVKCCPLERDSAITNRIAEFIARDLKPISTVDGTGFRQLMNYVEPGYQVPSCPHITATCRHLYSGIKEELLVTLSSPHVAFTTNLWTRKSTEAYLTVTAHFICEWNLVGKVLLTHEILERYTGMHIAARLCEAAMKWNIPDERVSAIVRDNAANMRVAVQELGWENV